LELLVGFGRFLRQQGLVVGTGRILTFCRAVQALAPVDRSSVYWAGRCSLVSRHQDFDLYDRAFVNYFGRSLLEETLSSLLTSAMPAPPSAVADEGAEPELVSSWGEPGDETDEGEASVALVASTHELLRSKSFHALDEHERAEARRLIHRLAVKASLKRSRRLRPAARGRAFDLRRTLRSSLATQGEPFRRARRSRRLKPRPLLLLLDVSGSMAAYSRALLQFGHSAALAGQRVEVFCFGTRLTRITRALKGKDPDEALDDVAELVQDWSGGTRIGASIRRLLEDFGQHTSIRGSVVVLCSDGLERDDPQLLADQMARLSRLAYRVVWVNPLKGDPRYQPLARGMAAALPHVDVFVPGHNLASLEALGEVMARA
jgi:uncharacterized protein with von Willebrand factor type A (vWA) domain